MNSDIELIEHGLRMATPGQIREGCCRQNPIKSEIGFAVWILSFKLWMFTGYSEAQWREHLNSLIV